MSVDLVRIVDSIHRDKNISKDILFEGIQSALATAAKKHYPDAAEIQVKIDPDSGQIEATKDGARMDPPELGRIAAQTAKQVIIQKIREAERDSLFDEFEDQRGDLVTGTVQRFEGGAVTVNLGKTDALLPRSEQIPGESHHPGERVRGRHPRRPQGRPAGQDHPQPDPSRLRPPPLRAGDPRDRRPDHLDPRPGPRGGLPLEGGRHARSTRRSTPSGPASGVRGHPDQEHRRRAGGRADRHRPLERVAPGADPQRLAAGRDRRGDALPAPGPGDRPGPRGPALAGDRPPRPERPAGLEARRLGHRDHDLEELDELIEKAVGAFTKIDGVDTDLAEKLVEQGILSFDDLSVMEIADLVNTIEGLTEEQAVEIVARAETLAEEQAEEMPRRKGAARRPRRSTPPRPTAARPSRRGRRARGGRAARPTLDDLFGDDAAPGDGAEADDGDEEPRAGSRARPRTTGRRTIRRRDRSGRVGLDSIGQVR